MKLVLPLPCVVMEGQKVLHTNSANISIDDLVGLTIADDLKSKIWKVYGNIFLLHPLIRV